MSPLMRLSSIVFVTLLCVSLLMPSPTMAAEACPPKHTLKYEILKRDPKCEALPGKKKPPCSGAKCKCQKPIEGNHFEIRWHMTDEFIKHRNWMIDEFFTKHILPAMAMMTAQLSTIAIQQVQMVGAFFDAKHQLETQRLFQQLMAEAHKDYQPSEGLCEIGTNVRSLAASSRKSDLVHVAFANRVTDRQLRNADTVAGAEDNSDINGRLKNFKKSHCNANDNSNGLSLLCASSTAADNSSGSSDGAGSNGSANPTNSTGGANGNSNSNSGSNSSNNNGNSRNNNGTSGNESENECETIFSTRDNDPDGGNGFNLKRFDTVEDNTGEDYVNSTGNYTVPCDGEYTFSGSAITLDPRAAELSIQKNGLDIILDSQPTANRQTMSVNITLDLKEGDVISLFTPQLLANASHTFRGRIISETDDGGGDDGGGDDGGDGGSGGAVAKGRANKDVDFSKTLGSTLTLDIDFTEGGSGEPTEDEEDVFSLTSNLFAHSVLPSVAKGLLGTEEGKALPGAYAYMNMRSISAKRSVAQNSIAAMVAERAKGDKEVAPFLKKLVTELGVKETEVEDILGKEPSYHAQMEVLTKNIYQNPVFFTELYDKPANVLRKGATIRALNLMQERDFYKSQLRSEAVLAIVLETMLMKEHNRVKAQLLDLEGK